MTRDILAQAIDRDLSYLSLGIHQTIFILKEYHGKRSPIHPRILLNVLYLGNRSIYDQVASSIRRVLTVSHVMQV